MRMKFWRRLLLLVSAMFLTGTLYYYVVLDTSVDLELQLRQREVVARLGASSFGRVMGSFSSQPDPAVCALRPGGGAGGRGQANLSTLDVFQDAHFNILGDGMYELPTPPPDYPSMETKDEGDGGDSTLEPLTVIIMPHSHADPGWQKTTNEYYTDQTKHIFTHMVNKLTQHPDLAFVWAETIYLSLWWNELEDAVKVHVRRLIRRGQLEVVLGGWVMPDEAASHYVAVIDQLMEGHQWLWENLKVTPRNSWSIDPFGYSGSMPYLWKLAGLDNMVIQRVHQAVKASLMSQRSMEFYWRQFWDREGNADILCHIMPYMLYSIKFSCGPNRFICLLFDFRSVPGQVSDTRAQSITDSNVEKFAEYLYKQFRQKSFFYKYNTILVPVGDDFRYEKEVEWDQQYGNYSRLMKYMNGRKDWNIHVKFGTLSDYFKLTRGQQLSKKYGGQDTDFPLLSGDFFPYSDRNLDYWTGYYSTRPFDKRFHREVQGMIQAADIAVTLTYALYKGWGREVQEKFFHLSSLMQTAHRAQGQFLHHDAITGTSRDFVVVDYESQLLEAYRNTQAVMRMALQALVSKGQVEKPYVFHPETVRDAYNHPPKKVKLTVGEGGLRLLVYNPLPQYRQQPVSVLVDTHRLYVKNHLRQIVPCQINPVWEEEITGVKSDVFEVVFVADLPPLASMPYVLFPWSGQPESSHPAVLSVFNSDTLVVPPSTPFQQKRPVASPVGPVVLENERLRVRVDAGTGEVMEVEDVATGNRTRVGVTVEVYRSQGSGAYLFRPKGGSEPLISNTPLIRVAQGPILTQLAVVYDPYLTTTLTLYHHPPLLASGVHVRNEVNIQTLKDHEVIMRLKTDLQLKKAHFFSDQNGLQYIQRRTNDNIALEANYYPMTSGAFLDDGLRRVSVLSGQPHGVASLAPGWLELMLDRHLTYDDGRGMEEGVQDIKTATSDFVLLVETRPARSQHPRGQQSQPAAHYAFPTVLSLALGDRLQQPPQLLYSMVESDVFFASLQPLKVSLPCDVALLSLRSLATGNLNYNGTSLLLHRRAYDCDFPAPGLQCGLASTSLSFHTFFQQFGLGVQVVRETTLTHLHHKRSLATSATLHVPPMRIVAYHLRF